MKRGTLYGALLLIALGGIAFYLFKIRSSNSSLKGEDRHFSVEDTGTISKIFLADKEGRSCTLTRRKTGWVVNDKYSCRSEAILNLMEVIRLIDVKMPVPKTAKNNVLKFMSSNAIKIEIYSGDEKIKQYYVGHEPPDSDGSYVLLSKPDGEENYPDPYLCFIPGFKGILQPRFITLENEWRDRLVLNYTPPQLTEIRLNYFDQSKDSSFQIAFKSQSEFLLRDKNGKDLNFDMGRMRQYLIYFQNISYESLITARSSRLLDSLNKVQPFAELEVVEKNGKINSYRFFRKAYTGEVNPELGTTFTYDPDRLFMNYDDRKEWALIQYFVFGKLLITPAYFVPPSVKK